MKKVIVILLSVMIVGVSGCGEKLEEKQVTTKIITEEMPESTITEEISSTTELVNKAELKPVKKDNKIETGGTLENKNVETEMPRQDQDTNRDSQITDDQPEIAADQLENTTSEKESSETTEITEKPNTTETSFVGYSPEDVVNLAIAKCTANGKITTEQNLDNLLSSGQITQDEYNEYYPLDGLDDSYFSVYVNIDLNKAATTSGSPLSSENDIAGYIAELISLESGSVFNMGSVFLSSDDEIIVIDPMNEYFDVAHTYGGTVVNMSTYTDNYVNPLSMDVWNLDQNDTKGWVREKGEFMLGLCEQCIGDSLNSRQKSIIDRCVRKMYIDIARSREKYIPVMSDFYEILMAQPEEEAKEIALSLELFVNGSLNIFNHQTNVDVDNRFVVYGIRDLGTELSPITMLVMMESIQQRIVENGKRGKATWLYIDEFHVLLNSEYSAKYLQQLWKKVRKQGGLCTGITQNVVDLLQNYTATTMLANSEFVALLKQANTDSAKMAEVIGVSDAQLRFVTNSQSGMGLLKCGNVVIPFDNQIGKDTSLYKLYNTNIHERIAEQKARERVDAL